MSVNRLSYIRLTRFYKYVILIAISNNLNSLVSYKYKVSLCLLHCNGSDPIAQRCIVHLYVGWVGAHVWSVGYQKLALTNLFLV